MDALKRYLYWIVIGALVAVTVVFYLAWVTPARDKCEKLGSERDTLSKALKKKQKLDGEYRHFVKNNPGKVPSAKLKPISNSRYTKAAAAYRAELNKRKAAIGGIFASHKLEIEGNDPIFNPPAPDRREEWAWQEWVNKLYPPVRDATAATVVLPVPPDVRDPGEEYKLNLTEAYARKARRGYWTFGGERMDAPVPQRDQEQILRRFLIWRSVHIALRSARVEVPERHPRYKTKPTRPGESLREDRRGKPYVVDEANTPVFLDEPGRKGHTHRVVQIDRINFGSYLEAGKQPYRVLPLDIEFAAHPAVVPEVLRLLQAEKRFVLVVRSLHMQQALLAKGGSLKERFKLDRYFEPVVYVKLKCQVMSFDETLDPVPTPKAKRAPRRRRTPRR